jgi:hypothetical protein
MTVKPLAVRLGPGKGPVAMNDNPDRRHRDWKKIHHSPLFWLGFVLFLAAITIYVLSGDLSWRLRLH